MYPIREIRLADLCVSRGHRLIIEGLSLAAARGTALLITGPNGAGKTTLLRAIAGFIRPRSGALAAQGLEDAGELSAHCHYFGHREGVKRQATVMANADFWRAYWHKPSGGTSAIATAPAPATRAVLQRLGLGGLEQVPARYLSAGQSRRLALSRLLLAPRPIWLMDEPTTSLDAQGQALLLSLIGEHLGQGGIALIATHLDLALDGAQRLRLEGTAS